MGHSVLELAVVANQSVVMQANDALSEVLSEHRLTHATAQALWAIVPEEEPPSMKTVAERLFCNAPNLTFVVNQLIDRGLVTKSIDPNDRRSRTIALTDDGTRVRRAVIEAALLASPLTNLDEQELRNLVDLLTKATAVQHPPTAE